MELIKKKSGNMEYYVCPEIQKAGFNHLFTTKTGGYSFNRSVLNFGTSCDDTEENIMKNYNTVFKLLDTTAEKTVKSKQTHSDIVLYVNSDFGGDGILREQHFLEADGLITDDSDLTLLVFYADCVPVIIADKAKKTACVVHSGWRGTKAEIVKKAVKKLIEKHGSRPENLLTAIGPAIGKCHFEVGENVYDEFVSSFGNNFCEIRNGKYYIDLKATVKNQLAEMGIPESNIAVSDLCTYCNNELYSYRREGAKAGRMAAFIKTPK